MLRWLFFWLGLGLAGFFCLAAISSAVAIAGGTAQDDSDHLWTFVFFIVVGLALVRAAVIAGQKEKEKEKARIAREAEAKEAERREMERRMVNCRITAMRRFQEASKWLSHADEFLDWAERYFDEHAFAPFWDSIEGAAKNLAYLHESIPHIKQSFFDYSELTRNYPGTPPRFPLAPQSIKWLDISTSVAKRMDAIVQKAQRDFEFAMIYEQRRTNQILVAGFTTLGDALDGMTRQIETSIHNLTSSLVEEIRELESSLTGIHDELSEGMSEALEKLDSIQRRRRPLL